MSTNHARGVLDVRQPLIHMRKSKSFNCKVIKIVYLEHNPISKDFEYRMRTAAMLPSLKQIDATPCRR